MTPYEQETLAKIIQEIPEEVRRRYNALIKKRRAENLTAAEHEELICLSDRIEGVEVMRLEYLAELANLRHISIATFLDMLNLTSPSYA